MSVETGSVPRDQLERRDPPQMYSQPLDGPNANDSESPVKEIAMRAPTWVQTLNAAPPTGPGRPLVGQVPPPIGVEGQTLESSEQVGPGAGYIPVGSTTGHPVPMGSNEGHVFVLHGEPGQMGPGLPFPGQGIHGVSPSPVKVPFGPGLVGSQLTPGTPPAVVSPVPGTPPAAKKRVSTLIPFITIH